MLSWFKKTYGEVFALSHPELVTRIGLGNLGSVLCFCLRFCCLKGLASRVESQCLRVWETPKHIIRFRVQSLEFREVWV